VAILGYVALGFHFENKVAAVEGSKAMPLDSDSPVDIKALPSSSGEKRQSRPTS
jgi:hypothetical protein